MIREIQKRDVPVIADIYNYYIKKTIITFNKWIDVGYWELLF